MEKPTDFGPILNGVMWFQVALATIFCVLRMYTRYSIIHNVGWDDALMMVNLATFIGFAAATSKGVVHGVGKKTAEIQHLGLDHSKAIMWEAIGQAICIMGIAASKSSIALFLLRIVRMKWHIVLLWFCIISTTAMSTLTTIMLFVQCRPTAFLWDQTIKGGYCWFKGFPDVGLSLGAWSATMDFVLALLPWHIILALKMKRKEKITIAVGLSLGILAGACSIVRTIELRSLSSMNEYVYDTATMLLWSSSEICLTVICACIPVLRPLYTKFVHGSRGDSSDMPSYPLHDYAGERRRKGSGTLVTFGSKPYIGTGAGVVQTTVDMSGKNTSEEAILKESMEQYGVLGRMHDVEQGLRMSRDIVITTTVTSRSEEV